jgi:PAS domain S-box-containing protein
MAKLILKKLTAIFTIAIAAVIANAVISYGNTNQLVGNEQHFVHALRVLAELESTLSILKDAETGQRGYLLTGDEAYLQPYQAAIVDIDQQIASLKQLTKDNPDQQRQLAVLEQRAANQLDLVRQTITLRRNSLEAAQPIVLSGQGKQIVDEVPLTADMEQEQETRLEQSGRQSQTNLQKTTITFTLTFLAGTGLLAYLYYLIRRDLLTRWQTETIMQESAKELEDLYNHAPCGYHSLNEQGIFIRINDTELRMLGYTREELIGRKKFSDLLTDESVHMFQQTLPVFKQQGKVNNLRFQMIRKDGSILPVILNAIAINDAAGNLIRSQSTILDGTERKQAEDALQTEKKNLELRVAERTAELLQTNQQLQHELNERKQIQASLEISQTRFAGILEIASDAIISVNAEQCITLFNQGAEKIFGYRADEVIGQPLDLLLPKRFITAHRQHVVDFAQSHGRARRMGERSEIFGRRKDGTEFPAEASISRLKLGNETIFTAILRDITDRKQIDRMKDEFVSVVSHELRTPLTSIHGSLGMLASGLLKPDSEQGKRMLQIAADSTDRLVRLINDILDIERIESGRVKMEKEFCQVNDLLTEAINVVQTLADKAQVTLSVTNLPIQIWADPDRIVQTLTNLLSNAIKFSPAGSTVWLSAEVKAIENALESTNPSPLSSSLPYILFAVKDKGRGIPTDKLDSIFERFQQVDSSDSRNHEGTGLGLAICRSIVQQHHGNIWAKSVLGEGSTFFFTLPLHTSQIQAIQARQNTSSSTVISSEQRTDNDSRI